MMRIGTASWYPFRRTVTMYARSLSTSSRSSRSMYRCCERLFSRGRPSGQTRAAIVSRSTTLPFAWIKSKSNCEIRSGKRLSLWSRRRMRRAGLKLKRSKGIHRPNVALDHVPRFAFPDRCSRRVRAAAGFRRRPRTHRAKSDASCTASLRSRASTTRKPPTCSLVSAYGPSVTQALPSRTRTVVAVWAISSALPATNCPRSWSLSTYSMARSSNACRSCSESAPYFGSSRCTRNIVLHGLSPLAEAVIPGVRGVGVRVSSRGASGTALTLWSNGSSRNGQFARLLLTVRHRRIVPTALARRLQGLALQGDAARNAASASARPVPALARRRRLLLGFGPGGAGESARAEWAK